MFHWKRRQKATQHGFAFRFCAQRVPRHVVFDFVGLDAARFFWSYRCFTRNYNPYSSHGPADGMPEHDDTDGDTRSYQRKPTRGTNITSVTRKRRRVRVKIAPWKDVYEWQSVAHGLRGALDLIQDGGRLISVSVVDPTRLRDLQQSLETLSVWKARSANALLPHAIESSFALAHLLLQDATPSSSSSLIYGNTRSSNLTLQLSYSTAIIRSVNGLADVLQQRRRVASPVSQLCTTLGLPIWIVDLRHEAAHNALPWLSQLRLGAATLLGFFLEKYWDSSSVLSVNSRVELLEATHRILQEFIKEQQQNLGSQERQQESSAHVDDQKQEEEDQQQHCTLAPDEEDDDETDREDDWLAENYFAALAQEPVQKKSKHQHENQSSSDDVANESDTFGKITNLSQESNCARIETPSLTRLVHYLTTLPQDVVYEAIVSIFVWGRSDSVGLLLSTIGDEVYKPLLKQLCLVWPGLFTAIMIHCVEYRLVHQEKQKGLDDNISNNYLAGKQCPLAQWMRRNSDFLQSIKTDFPIRSLCARLEHGNELRQALENIFPKGNGNVVMPEGVQVQEANGMDTFSNWSIVETWDSCTIGCLPGHTI